MILNDYDIKRQCEDNAHPLVFPFVGQKVEKGDKYLVNKELEEVYMSFGLEPQGYTLRLDCEDDFLIQPLRHEVVNSLEILNLPSDICAFFRGKSSYTRRGIVFSTAVVDAGYHGKLQFVVFNCSDKPVRFFNHEGIAQICFHQLTGKSGFPYQGVHQGHGI
jgi:deoxycytidine triphosphate deaminase